MLAVSGRAAVLTIATRRHHHNLPLCCAAPPDRLPCVVAGGGGSGREQMAVFSFLEQVPGNEDSICCIFCQITSEL